MCCSPPQHLTALHGCRRSPQVGNLNGNGGGDVPEDIVGALDQVARGSSRQQGASGGGLEWRGRVRFCVIVTDAPTHGCHQAAGLQSSHEAHEHATQAYRDAVAKKLQDGRINLMFCTLNAAATRATERALKASYEAAGDLTMPGGIPLFHTSAASRPNIHFVFVLDESGSMSGDWGALVHAYCTCIQTRQQVTQRGGLDLVSVVQFASSARITASKVRLDSAPGSLRFNSGGTCYAPALSSADQLLAATPSTHKPVLVFMTDGCPGDGAAGLATMRAIRSNHASKGLQVGVTPSCCAKHPS